MCHRPPRGRLTPSRQALLCHSFKLAVFETVFDLVQRFTQPVNGLRDSRQFDSQCHFDFIKLARAMLDRLGNAITLAVLFLSTHAAPQSCDSRTI
jgi:hypothetical protein